MFNKIYYLFCIIVVCLTLVNTLSIDLTKINNKDQEDKPEDDFYLIYIDNTKKNTHKKRQETSDFIDSFIGEIHDLIIDNVDTYKDPETLKELDNEDAKLRKRDSDVRYLVDYGDSNYIYPISETESKTVLYAYLSESLVPIVKSRPEVIDVLRTERFDMNSYYNKDEIKGETNWNKIKIRKNTDLHLSIISQGEFDDERAIKYDKNYYYPESAGKDIDLFILDVGFNFNHPEFSNRNERVIKCLFNVTRAKVIESNSNINCFGKTKSNHGTAVAAAAAGKEHGVANKANIYGVLLDEINEANVISALEYIKQNLFRPHKAIFNLSFGSFHKINKSTHLETSLRQTELYEELTNEGAILFAAAGNNGKLAYNDDSNEQYLPCSHNFTICVGGIENVEEQHSNSHIFYSDVSRYEVSKGSNYGRGVDIYAPYNAYLRFPTHSGDLKETLVSGTSISSPLAAGVAATIMSEFPDRKFDKDAMLSYLTKIGQRDIIDGVPDDAENLFLNNGKRVVYSSNGKYEGCGVLAGNQKCKEGLCCSEDGFCGTGSKFCGVGCQPKYGLCY